MEEWKDIIGFEGSYMVSDHGRVKSLKRIISQGKRGERWLPEMMLKPLISNVGYARVRIGPQLIPIHRIVAKHFISNPENKPIVNHKDGIKLNNHSSNLEWCTNTENQRHAWATGLKKAVKGEKHPSSKISDVIRNAIIQLHVQGQRTCEIARQFNLHQDYVNKILIKSGQFIKRPRAITFVGEVKKAYYRNYQYMWQRRKREV